jgi:hypothetical protein
MISQEEDPFRHSERCMFKGIPEEESLWGLLKLELHSGFDDPERMNDRLFPRGSRNDPETGSSVGHVTESGDDIHAVYNMTYLML